MANLADHAYRHDMKKRSGPPNGPFEIRLAAHLEGHLLRSIADPVVTALRVGADMSAHVSPMAAARKAFQRASNKGDWNKYNRVLDRILNKWGIYHFHAKESQYQIFVCICLATRSAFVLDIRGHDRDWKIERHLVGIMVENWPEEGLVVEVGRSGKALTEEDLLKARDVGFNLPVHFGEKSYLPPSRGLMMDGTGYDTSVRTIPLVIVADRFNPAAPVDAREVNPSGIMMLGVAPDDPRPPWEIAAEHLGRLSMQRRRT